MECEVITIHEDRIKEAQSQLIDETSAAGLTEIFQALADPSRVRLISGLMSGELCVCDLAVLTGMSQSAVSHQLRLLRNLHLVKNHKEGRVVYYSIDDDHVHELFHLGLKHYLHQQNPNLV
jgi:DNA-binding transcriptional ArsR family regulator